jgi:hypothetical protein
MSECKESLERQMRKLRRELNAIEERENEEKFGGLVGKCFTYRNCYSCPEKPSDYWQSYCRVSSITGAYATVMEFEIDKEGMIRIHPERCMPANMLGSSWKEITRAQFNKQAARCLKATTRILSA